MPFVVTVCSRWGDYVLGVQDLRPGQSLQQPPVVFTAGEPQVAGQLLREGATVTLSGDDITYDVSYERAEPVPRALPRPWLALGALAVLSVAVLGGSAERRHKMHSALHGMASRPVPPTPLADSVPEAPRVLSVSSEREPSLAVPGKTRCGQAEMGVWDMAEPNGRYAVRGPKDNPDPHLAKKTSWVGSSPTVNDMAELGWAQEPLFGSRAPTAPWGRKTQAGTETTDAHGQMWGEDFGLALGEDGMGRHPEPGGVAKEIEVAATATARPRLLHAGLRVTGRKPSEVARELAAHFPEFQRCAETFTPPAAREVRLTFDIAAAGQVNAAPSADALAACLIQGVEHARFAEGEPAHVVYPLHILPAATDLHVAPTQVTRDSCQCG